jgi:hypothetical protein
MRQPRIKPDEQAQQRSLRQIEHRAQRTKSMNIGVATGNPGFAAFRDVRSVTPTGADRQDARRRSF